MNKLNIIRLLVGVISCIVLVNCTTLSKAENNTASPAHFTARFETSKGDFDIESRKEWSPLAVDRLYELIESGFYRDVAIYRVIPDYIAQFGIHNDSLVNKAWREIKLKDEPAIEPNVIGTLSFARGAPNSRGTALFINLQNNSPFLDTISFMEVTGFPVVARIISGIDVAKSFYGGYGEALDAKQDSIVLFGNKYLKNKYPKLDYIHKAYITGAN